MKNTRRSEEPGVFLQQFRGKSGFRPELRKNKRLERFRVSMKAETL
jgi:hypothetical protein